MQNSLPWFGGNCWWQINDLYHKIKVCRCNAIQHLSSISIVLFDNDCWTYVVSTVQGCFSWEQNSLKKMLEWIYSWKRAWLVCYVWDINCMYEPSFSLGRVRVSLGSVAINSWRILFRIADMLVSIVMAVSLLCVPADLVITRSFAAVAQFLHI